MELISREEAIKKLNSTRAIKDISIDWIIGFINELPTIDISQSGNTVTMTSEKYIALMERAESRPTEEELFEEHVKSYQQGREHGLIEAEITCKEDRATGKWKMLSSGFFECDNCKCRLQFPIFSNGDYANFCPHCGADMRGEE